MMKILFTVILIITILSSSCSHAQDTKLILWLNSHQYFSGELLYVRDSSLVVNGTLMADTTSKMVQAAMSAVIPNDSITRLVVRRGPIFFKTAVAGLLGGAALGAIIGYTIGKDDKSLAQGSLAFGGLGLTIGLVAAAVTPSGDEELNIRSRQDRDKLKRIARYKDREPADALRIH